MYDAFIKADKAVNHKVFGGYWNQTVSRNAGSKIGRATGTSTQTGTDIFHGALLLGGGLVVATLLGGFSKE
jgi:hypothetical protein